MMSVSGQEAGANTEGALKAIRSWFPFRLLPQDIWPVTRTEALMLHVLERRRNVHMGMRNLSGSLCGGYRVSMQSRQRI
jgi:hypothetical protein